MEELTSRWGLWAAGRLPDAWRYAEPSFAGAGLGEGADGDTSVVSGELSGFGGTGCEVWNLRSWDSFSWCCSNSLRVRNAFMHRSALCSLEGASELYFRAVGASGSSCELPRC